MDRSRVGFTGLVAFAVLAVVCALPTPSYAEERTLEQQIQMVRSLTEAQRQATMAANVIMTDAEGAKFWPIYRDYRNEVARLNDKAVALMQQFAQNFDALRGSEAEASGLALPVRHRRRNAVLVEPYAARTEARACT